MTTKKKDLFGFINDLEKIIYVLGFQLIIKRNNNDRALFRVKAGAGAVPCIDPSNDNRIIVQKGLRNKNIKDFSFL